MVEIGVAPVTATATVILASLLYTALATALALASF